MTKSEPIGNIPSLYFYPSVKLDIKCPSCGFEASVVLKEKLDRQMKAGCHKCNNRFLIKPNVRRSYRKLLEVEGHLSRLDMKENTMALKMSIRISDISVNGIGTDIRTALLAKRRLTLGETFFVTFHLPKREKELQVKGKLMSIFESDAPNISHLGMAFEMLENHIEQEIRFYMM